MFTTLLGIESLKAKRCTGGLQRKTVAVVFCATIFTLLLLTPVLVRTASSQAADSLEISISTSPTRLHEGDNTTITLGISKATPEETYIFGINVSNPVGTSSSLNLTVMADSDGLGSSTTQYWGAFAGANTTDVGTYLVAVMNLTTNKILTATSFTVEVWPCQLLARDLANEPVPDLTITAFNETNVPAKFLNQSRVTNDTGWASFMLATGNYTFEAFWKQVKVGGLPTTRIENDTVLEKEHWIQLTNLEITVKDEATNESLSFIQLKLEYNYTTGSNENLTETIFSETNFTGTVRIHNLLVNNSYVVVATRYGVSGLTLPPVHNETTPLPWHNITVTFPVYTAFVHVVDSKNNAVSGVQVEAHEWSSGLVQTETTDSNGNATFSLTFGRYRVRIYSGTILLEETQVDLTQDQSSFPISLPTYNVDLTVKVVDCFQQPIPNVMVKIERRVGRGYESTAPSGFTGLDGRVTFSGFQGGDSRILVYVRGQLSETRGLHLADSERVTFVLDRYAVILSYALETSQLATAILIVAICVIFILALTYKKLLRIFPRNR